MVRSIKSCSLCSVRFVSHGGKKKSNDRKNQTQQRQCDYYLCSRCDSDNNSSLQGKTATTIQTQVRTGEGFCPLPIRKPCSGKENNKNITDGGGEDLYLEPPPKSSSSSVVHLTPNNNGFDDDNNENYFCDNDDDDDDDDSDRSGGGSEGGDDVHCTQIIEIIESSQDDSIDEEALSEQQIAQNLGESCFQKFHSTTAVAETTSTIPIKITPTVDAEKQKALLQAYNQQQPQHQPQHQHQTPPLPKPNAATAATTKAAGASSGDICFICGADLSRLKRRINHIKRCSKKHGITGRDVRQSASNESPSPSSPSAATTAADITTGQHPNGDDETTRRENGTSNTNWHGDAEKLLKLTKQVPSCRTIPAAVVNATPTTGRTVSGYDAILGKFVVAKSAASVDVSATRNLNNVLMAGSRRLEVTTKVANKRGEIERQGGRGSSNKNNANKKKRTRYSDWNCPMYKKITGTDFIVDGFHYAKQSLTKNYFLTHFHSDHYGGITSSWDVGTIFCSLPTASLVSQQLRVDKKYIHPLPMNTPTVVESRGKAITVTLLDANHCPGAVMFLFEVGKRTMLHVGDFRWSRDAMLGKSNKDGSMLSSPLHDIVSEKVVLDELYLDTTYCHEKYQLPPQSETIKATIETFEKELERCKKTSKRTLHLFGAYTIGKEKIFLSVAERFGLKVYVDKARHRILSTLNLPEEHTKLLTTDREDSNLWVVPMGHLNMKKMPEYFAIANSKPFAPQYDRIVGYRPTGWSLSRSGMVSSRNSGKVTIHSVPYSEHSSYPELVDCLACLKPAKIIPTVNASKSNEQVKLLLQGLRNKQTALKMFSKSSSIQTP